MLDTLEQSMPEGITWTRPAGGFYVWLTMQTHLNATKILDRSLAQGAAFVIGNAFDPQGVKNNTMRLAFSYTPEEKIEKGIRIIADAIKGDL
jgi:DNA-binding transcriptional MocR family regulator